jgi:hypothetical protein
VGGEILKNEIPWDIRADIACGQGDAETLSDYLREPNPEAWVLDAIGVFLIAGIASYYPVAGPPDPTAPVSLYLADRIDSLRSLGQLDRMLILSHRGSGRLRNDAHSLQSETIALLMRLVARTPGHDEDLTQELGDTLLSFIFFLKAVKNWPEA